MNQYGTIREDFLVGSGVQINKTCESDKDDHHDFFFSSSDLSPNDYVRFNSLGLPVRKTKQDYADMVESVKPVTNEVDTKPKHDTLPDVKDMLPTKTMVSGVEAEPHTYNYCRHIFAPVKAKGYANGDPIRGDIEISANTICNSGWFVPHQSKDPARNLHKGAMRHIFGNRTSQV